MVKISAALIVRDESANIVDCLNSIRPHVDEIVVVDTGSVDNTVALARGIADRVEVFTACNDAAGLIDDFALARNKSYELVSNDWIFWLDGDDVVQGAEGLRPMAAEMDGKVESALLLMPYDYMFDAAGNCTCVHWRERLTYPRGGWRWQTPCHEVLLPNFPEKPAATGHSDKIRIIHRRQQLKKPIDPQRNLRILKKYVEKCGEGDVRALYYLGLEYGYNGDRGNALRVLRRYIEISGGHVSSRSGWVDEKCLGMLAIANIYIADGYWQDAIEWLLQATAVKSWAEPYFGLSRCYYALAMQGFDRDYNFKRSASFATLGLSLPETQTLLFVNPLDRATIHQYLNVSYYHLGDIDKAAQSCRVGLAAAPHLEGLRTNLANYEQELSKRDAVTALERVRDSGAIDDAHFILLRETLHGRYTIDEITAGAPSRKPGGPIRPLDIAVVLGPALERWTPETLTAKGMGGSETMAWEVCKRLASEGHSVRVYGDCAPVDERVYDGVQWFSYQRAVELKACDVLIASRRPSVFDMPITFSAGYLWAHDVHCGDEFTPPRAAKLTAVLCLSRWHCDLWPKIYPWTKPGLVRQTRNGIDLTRFVGSTDRDHHRAFYSSSPDRGLLTAVECWPRIRRKVPDATLHVYYGFDNWEKSIELAGDSAQLTSVRQLREIIQATDGVTLHGRINQAELAREMQRCGVWANATWFSETSCITAMEAQAAGCLSVTSPIAALNETCDPESTYFQDGDWRSEEYKRGFTKAVIDAMMVQDGDAALRGRVAKGAERFDLDSLVAEWQLMFYLDLGMSDNLPSFEEFQS